MDVATPSRYKFQPSFRRGQRMGLCPMLHLQPMFNDAQEGVRFGQAGPLELSQILLLCKTGEHDQCLRGSNPRFASPVLELKRLSDKFDLSNASAAELDVVAAPSCGFFFIYILFSAAYGFQSVGQGIPREN